MCTPTAAVISFHIRSFLYNAIFGNLSNNQQRNKKIDYELTKQQQNEEKNIAKNINGRRIYTAPCGGDDGTYTKTHTTQNNNKQNNDDCSPILLFLIYKWFRLGMKEKKIIIKKVEQQHTFYWVQLSFSLMARTRTMALMVATLARGLPLMLHARTMCSLLECVWCVCMTVLAVAC